MKKIDVFNYIVNKTSDEDLDVHIDGAIVDASTQQILKDWWGDETSVSFKSFRDQLITSKAKKVNIFINSPGGHVGDAMAIHDMLVDLQSNGVEVNTKGRGIVASAATYILMAGNSEMSANSWFMIHNVSGGVWGDVNIIENYARTLRKFNDSTRDFYSSYTGMRKEDVSKMMNAETWLTADEAKEKGFVKNITGKVSFANSIPAEQWGFDNKAILNLYNQSVKKIKMENLSFQNTLATAQAEAFEVVENGFLLTEENLTNIENRIAQLTTENTTSQERISEMNAAAEAVQQSISDLSLQLDAANARTAELEAEVSRLASETALPAGTAKAADEFGADPEAKYLTSVDAEMAQMRALRNK